MARSRSRSRGRNGGRGWRRGGGWKRGGLSAYEQGRRDQQSADDRARARAASGQQAGPHQDRADRGRSRGRSRSRDPDLDHVRSAVRTVLDPGAAGSAWGSATDNRRDVEITSIWWPAHVGDDFEGFWSFQNGTFPGADELWKKDPSLTIFGLTVEFDTMGFAPDLRGRVRVFVDDRVNLDAKWKIVKDIPGHWMCDVGELPRIKHFVVPKEHGKVDKSAAAVVAKTWNCPSVAVNAHLSAHGMEKGQECMQVRVIVSCSVKSGV